MKLLVTGASGFLGRHVVAEALRRGHSVRAVVRPGRSLGDLSWCRHPAVELSRIDLRSRGDLAPALDGVETILHLAAKLSGDFYDQFQSTVMATENLLDAVTETGRSPRFVHVSTFSVYEHLHRPSGALLDEHSALDRQVDTRDEYTITKTIQERLVQEHAAKHGWPLVILRPGVIYGAGRYFCAELGMQPSPRWWVRVGWFGEIALTYVENCADAVLLAAEKPEATGRTFNVVDDPLPTRREVVRELRSRVDPTPRILPLPWWIVRAAARLAWATNRFCLGGRAKLPGLLVPSRAHARFKPCRYTNAWVRATLGWSPRLSLAQALDRTFSGKDTTVPVHLESEPVET